MAGQRRRVAAVIVMVLGIAALAVLPGHGAPGILVAALEFVQRGSEGDYLPHERAQLQQLECWGDALGVIPDGASATVVSDDVYTFQRVSELAYPRIRLTLESADYLVHANAQQEPDGEVLVAQECDDSVITVVRRD